ncbi:MAG: hypothetical protein ABI883_00580 [Chthoniobacterales bacterium]
MSKHSALLPIWVVGFTGHRRLDNPDAVGATLLELITSLAAEIPDQIVGHSSIAIGGDTLFAEACLSLDIPWIALLPVAEDDFRSDFTEAEWTKARQLLQRAARLQSLPAVNDRNIAYLECGLATVEDADVMIAIWDGEPSRGPGGTADVIAHARVLGKPLILIHPDRLSVVRERFTLETFSDSEMEYFNHLPDRSSGAAKTPAQPPDAQARVLRFFEKVDAEATRNAPSFRRWVAASVIMNTLAAILVAATIGLRLHSIMLDTTEFILLGGAVLSVVWIKRQRAHRNWIRCRVAAEICRSSLATWHLGHVVPPIWYSHLADFSRLAKSIRLLQMRAQNPALSFAECRENYLAYRISGQLRYFTARSGRLASALTWLTCGFWIFSAASLGRTLFATFFSLSPSYPNMANVVVSFLPIALPLVAGCALSLISIFDLGRQLESSRGMEGVLREAHRRIEKCENLSSLRRAVESIEDTLAAEFMEWFALFKFPRFK